MKKIRMMFLPLIYSLVLAPSLYSSEEFSRLNQAWEAFQKRCGENEGVRKCVESVGTKGECSGLWQEEHNRYVQKKKEIMDKWSLKDPEKFRFEFEYYDFCGKMYRSYDETIDTEKDGPVKQLKRWLSYNTLKKEVAALENLQRQSKAAGEIVKIAQTSREEDPSLRNQRIAWLMQERIPLLKEKVKKETSKLVDDIRTADSHNEIEAFYGPMYHSDVCVPEIHVYDRCYKQCNDANSASRIAFLWLFSQMKKDCLSERYHPINAWRDQRSTCIRWIETTEKFIAREKDSRGAKIDINDFRGWVGILSAAVNEKKGLKEWKN